MLFLVCFEVESDRNNLLYFEFYIYMCVWGG